MVSYQALWPHVLGYSPIKVVVVRDPRGGCAIYLSVHHRRERSARVGHKKFSERWSIEVLFRASKQTLDIEGPQHWCQQSVEKVAPWVWSMQSVLMVWYISHGRDTPEAAELRARAGRLGQRMVPPPHAPGVLASPPILNATIDPNSADEPQLRELLSTLEKLCPSLLPDPQTLSAKDWWPDVQKNLRMVREG